MKKLINKGFTLAETVIVIAITAVMATMVVPDIVSFLQFYESRSETETLQEIKSALKAYSEDWGTLPAEPVWYQDLAPYTGLSEDTIRFDPWFRERYYRMFNYNYSNAITEGFRGQELTASYAMVMTYGPDNLIDPDTVLVDSTGTFDSLAPIPIDPTLALGPMPAVQEDARDVYSSLSAGGDDQIIVFTNLPDMVKKIEITKNRIDTIRGAIESYASAKKAADATPTDRLYRPMSWLVPGPADLNSNYDLDVRLEVDAYLPGPFANKRFVTVIHGTPANEVERRDDMIKLVRFLGLTDDYCCDALQRYDHDGIASTPDTEKALFYYSNPRGTNLPFSNCKAVRPTGAANGTPFLPVRVMRELSELNADANNCG